VSCKIAPVLLIIIVIAAGCGSHLTTGKSGAGEERAYPIDNPTADNLELSNIYLQQAKRHYAEGDYRAAQGACENAVELNHQNWEAHYYLGLASQKKNEYTTSIEVLSVSLKYSPENNYIKSEIHFAIGISWEKLGELDKAEDEFEEALSYNSEHHSARDAKNRIKVEKTLRNWGKDTVRDYEG